MFVTLETYSKRYVTIIELIAASLFAVGVGAIVRDLYKRFKGDRSPTVFDNNRKPHKLTKSEIEFSIQQIKNELEYAESNPNEFDDKEYYDLVLSDLKLQLQEAEEIKKKIKNGVTVEV